MLTMLPRVPSFYNLTLTRHWSDVGAALKEIEGDRVSVLSNFHDA